MRTKLKGTQNKHNNSLIETENEEEENFLNQKEIKMTVHHWHDYFKNIKSKKLGSFSFDNREKEISRMYLIKHVNYILSND